MLLVGVSSALLGMLCGGVFGLLDVEDSDVDQLRAVFREEQTMCYPLAAILGGIAGVADVKIRQDEQDYRFDPVQTYMLSSFSLSIYIYISCGYLCVCVTGI